MTGLPEGFSDTVKPMLAKVEPTLPRGEGWTYEPKWDGFRCLVFRDEEGVQLQSREERPLGRYLPELVNLLESAPPPSFVADGEVVIVRPGGLGFDELLQRIHPAASRVAKLAAQWPATLILFDLLADGVDDLRDAPISERRERLTVVASRIGAAAAPQELSKLNPGPELLLTPWTDDVALAERWFADEAGIGQDGVIAKPRDLTYRPGDRAMVKVKHRRSVDCVVGGYRLNKERDGVGSLLLGLYDGDTLH